MILFDRLTPEEIKSLTLAVMGQKIGQPWAGWILRLISEHAEMRAALAKLEGSES